MIFKSSFIPSRTRTSSSTSAEAPTARVVGPTRATARSPRSQTVRPLMARFTKFLSFSIERMTRETSWRPSTRTNSRILPASSVVSARVIRAASCGRFNPGVCPAEPTRPDQMAGQLSGWSLRQRFGRSSRSNWSELIDKIASVSCGNHSRLAGD